MRIIPAAAAFLLSSATSVVGSGSSVRQARQEALPGAVTDAPVEDLPVTRPGPGITGMTPRVFRSNRVCVCGNFPDDRSRSGLRIGDLPLGSPVFASPYVNWYEVPEDAPPGKVRVRGDPAAGFAPEGGAEGELLALDGSVDRRRLELGESTPLRLRVRGTDEPVTIDLTNHTPGVISLTGGAGAPGPATGSGAPETVTLTTSGGSDNAVERTVTGIRPGDFRLTYRVAADPCPCADETPVFWDPGPGPVRVGFGGGPYIGRTFTSLPPGDSLVRGPSDSRGGSDPDDPSDEPPPTVYGEEVCPVAEVEGRFQPSQGVWQDDPAFEDRAGKQIVQVSPRSLRAELPMVRGRMSLLFGTIRPVGGVPEPRRYEIFMRGRSSGTVPVPVRMRFTLKQAAGTTWSHTTPRPVGTVPLGGPCATGATTRWEVTLDAGDGIPPRATPPFRFGATGDYVLEAELVRMNGTPTGIKTGVLGTVVETEAPSIAFRPVALFSSSLEEAFLPRLRDAAAELSRQPRLMQDHWPVAQVRGGSPFRVRVFDVLDLSGHLEGLIRSFAGTPLTRRDDLTRDLIEAEVARRMQARGLMSGFDRTVAVLDFEEWGLTEAGELRDSERLEYGGFALSDKVVVVGAGRYGSIIVSHELIHTIEYVFSSRAMRSLCGRGYHGENPKIAFGHRISVGGRDIGIRRARRGVSGIMEYGDDDDSWITQCTYHNLVNELAGGPPDPPVLLVQGWAARRPVGLAGRRDTASRGGPEGLLMPLHHFDGIPDLSAVPAEAGADDWSVVLRDAEGAAIGTYGFRPRFSLPDLGVERDLVGFAYRVPDDPRVRRVDLLAPGGRVLDIRTYSPHAPAVSVSVPEEGALVPVRGGRVRVAWEATDADGDSLLSTVLYSPDDGETWVDLAFEADVDELDVPVEETATAHRIRVRVTDGARSGEAEVSFRTRGPEASNPSDAGEADETDA